MQVKSIMKKLIKVVFSELDEGVSIEIDDFTIT